MIRGELKANALEVTTFKVVLAETPAIIAKFVLTNTETRVAHAVVEELSQGGWSDATYLKVRELAQQIEEDLAKQHMMSISSAQKGEYFPEGGIGEYLASKDAKSV